MAIPPAWQLACFLPASNPLIFMDTIVGSNPSRYKQMAIEFWLVVGLTCFPALAAADELDDALAVIAKVGPDAAGSGAARQARDFLARQGPEALPRLLNALDTKNVVAANWYRTAFDAIAERELAKPTPQLPRVEIERYVRDEKHSGRARRLGLAVLERLDPSIRGQLLPIWLDDPEFRRDAVEHALSKGDLALKEKQSEPARQAYEQAFLHARESDQVLQAVAKLKSVGQVVDPIAHLGFIDRWWLVGPFPAPAMTGFAAEFPPEKQVDLKAEYSGEGGQKLRWKLHQTADQLGESNLISAIAAVKESVGYAYAEIESPAEQPVELRCSADDNLTVWLNGTKVLDREQWLNGTRLDRFITPVKLQAGTNRILVKICQGPQHVNPEVPNNWSFQLRLCDATGIAAKFKNLLPAPRP
jgi:hypothetical protein